MERSVVVGGVLVSASLLLAILLNTHASRQAAQLTAPDVAEQEAGASESSQHAVDSSSSPEVAEPACAATEADVSPTAASDVVTSTHANRPH